MSWQKCWHQSLEPYSPPLCTLCIRFFQYKENLNMTKPNLAPFGTSANNSKVQTQKQIGPLQFMCFRMQNAGVLDHGNFNDLQCWRCYCSHRVHGFPSSLQGKGEHSIGLKSTSVFVLKSGNLKLIRKEKESFPMLETVL